MATRRRNQKSRNTARTLKGLICVLAIILVATLAVAFTIGNRTGDDPTLQSDPPVQNTGGATSGNTTVPNTTPTTVPTDPPPTGWVEEDGKTYYYGDDSVLRTGAQEINGAIYCFGTDGALLSAGWQDIGESRYYVTADGTAHTGWLELEDDLYYLRTDGTMARGELEIDGQTWFFTSAGCQIYMVNPWHSVPEDYDVTLVKLPDDYGTNRYVADYMYDALMQMIYDCEAAMVELYGSNAPTLWVRSANRSNYDQTVLFENKVARVKAANPNLTQAEAEAEAATVVAIPGTSEHQLGLAVDIIDTQLWDLVEEQEDLEGQQWLMENCWRYGFILRYPKGTTDITGIIYEPWHYRYVGLDVAAEIHELGVTLEEYLANLS